MRSALTETVSATLREIAWVPSAGANTDLVLVRGLQLPLQLWRQPGIAEVVQDLLGLVLEAQDPHLGAGLDVGQQHALLAGALDDRMAVRQVLVAGIAASMRSSSTGDIACSSRSASSMHLVPGRARR